MHDDAFFSHPLRNADNLFLGHHHARECVLERDEFRRRRVNVFAEDAVVEDFFESQVVTVTRWYGVRSCLRVERDAAGFVQVNVSPSVEDDGVRWLSQMCANGKLVGPVVVVKDVTLCQLEGPCVIKEQRRGTDIVPLTANMAASLPVNLAMRSKNSFVA